MRVYIMTDMEGVAGVLDSDNWCLLESRYYEQGKELLTRETNAAIEGFLAAGAKEIVVADGHGYGGIVPSLLHPAAELARNWTAEKPYPFSLDAGRFDAAAWIGQHPKAGTVGGHLCHTGSMLKRNDSINGVSIGEFAAIALCAGELGIPSIFASGCEAFTREAQAFVPGIEAVAVKRGTQTTAGNHLPEKAYNLHNIAAIHLSPDEARRRIRAGAQRALERARREKSGLAAMRPPYRRVTVLRSDETHPPRLRVVEHPTSIIALLNEQGPWQDLDIDPLNAVSL